MSVTEIDCELASIYFPILMEEARKRRVIRFGELVNKAKDLHPDNSTVKNAIPVNTGRRLGVLRQFTEQEGYPDLSSLVVGADGQCPPDSPHVNSWEEVRESVYHFDWSSVSQEFALHVNHELTKTQRLTTRNEQDAKGLMWSHYQSHKKELPSSIGQYRCHLVQLLMEGIPVEDAFEEVTLLASGN